MAAVDDLLVFPHPHPAAPRAVPAAEDLKELAQLLENSERGLLVCGPAPIAWGGLAEQVAALAARAGLAIFADPASQLRFRAADGGATFLDGFDALLHSPTFRRFLRPDLILQLGRSPTSGAWERSLADLAGVEHRVLLPYGWHDPASTATGLLFADPEAALDGLLQCLPDTPRAATPWLEQCRAADELAWRLADDELAAAEGLTEGAVARAVVEGLPAEGLLVVGNSLPIREVDTWCRRRRRLLVASQRGASGIDGVVSGAAGAARAHGGAAALLVGDVSFLHDLSGLSTVRQVESPLAVVVVQNRGGRIFEQLPVANHPEVSPEDFDHWLTPHEDEFSSAAALYKLPYVRVEAEGLPPGREGASPFGKRGIEGDLGGGASSALTEALAEALRRPGATVIEAVVPPHGAAEQNQRYWRRLEDLLREEIEG